MLRDGLSLAAGVFLGNAVVVPMLFHGDYFRGIMTGIIAAILVLLTYYCMGLFYSEPTQRIDSDC